MADERKNVIIALNTGAKEEQMLSDIMDFLCTTKKSVAMVWAINQAHRILKRISAKAEGEAKASNIGKASKHKTEEK